MDFSSLGKTVINNSTIVYCTLLMCIYHKLQPVYSPHILLNSTPEDQNTCHTKTAVHQYTQKIY